MMCCKSKLQKHHLTRRLFKAEQIPLDEAEKEMREGLEWQFRLSDVLIVYADEVSSAFEALARAVLALEEGGIEAVDEAYPLVQSLVRGFQEAQSITRNVAQAIATSLQTHKATLSACADDLSVADRLSAEVLRYQTKLESLTEQDEKLARNQKKLQEAESAASVAQMRAHDALRSCISRRGMLVKLAREAVTATAEAFKTVVREVGGQCGVDKAENLETASLVDSNSCNPFEEDLADSATLHCSKMSPNGSKSPFVEAAQEVHVCVGEILSGNGELHSGNNPFEPSRASCSEASADDRSETLQSISTNPHSSFGACGEGLRRLFREAQWRWLSLRNQACR